MSKTSGVRQLLRSNYVRREECFVEGNYSMPSTKARIRRESVGRLRCCRDDSEAEVEDSDLVVTTSCWSGLPRGRAESGSLRYEDWRLEYPPQVLALLTSRGPTYF
jgi:hypothetical protein